MHFIDFLVCKNEPIFGQNEPIFVRLGRSKGSKWKVFEEISAASRRYVFGDPLAPGGGWDSVVSAGLIGFCQLETQR